MKKRFYILIILSFLMDLISKVIVINYLDLYQSIKVIPNFFYLTYVRNTGSAFSLFEDKQMLILLITVIALFYINKYLNKENLKKYEMISYSLITGGILGNLFDRLVYGYVIDFFDFNIFGYNAPIFNIADILIVGGTIILIIFYYLKGDYKNGSSSRK